MADTVFVAIVTTGWTQVSAGLTGFITNESDNPILYLEAATAPADSVTTGHTLNPRRGRAYNVGAGQEVYARAIAGASSVSNTDGTGFL